MTRDELLALSNDELLRQCRVERHRASGPGGQHRNKVETAIRLTLLAHPGIVASGAECRSQKANRDVALARLRHTIAMNLRSEPVGPWTGDTKLNPSNPRYPVLIAALLDAMQAADYDLGAAAELLTLSVGQLRRLLGRDAHLFEHINRERQSRGMSPLRT